MMSFISFASGGGPTIPCTDANPFCTAISYDFPNETNTTAPTGPNYGCLGSQPNPVWYYMEVDQAGSFQIGLSQTTGPNGTGTGLDVDFALWGPFASLSAGCTSIMGGQASIQCSYSTSYTETVGIGMPGGTGTGASTPPAATAGQVYIVIITNFNGGAGYISFNQTGGTGVADCSIVSPCSVTANNSGPFCAGSGLLTNLTASTIAGATYSWTGPAGFTSSDQNPTNVPVPSAAGNYDYTVEVNDAGNICSTTTTVVVNPLPDANAGPDGQLTCTNTSISLAGSSATPGVTYSWTGPGVVSGGSSTSPTVNQAGTYTITVTNPATGCQNTDQALVTQNITPPNANAGSAINLTCASPTQSLSGSSSTPGANYSWSGPGIVSGGTTLTPTVNAAGSYTLTVTNPLNGCTANSSVTVTSNITPPNANAGVDMTITCTNPSITLNGSSSTSGVNYSWTGPGIVSGGTSANPTVNQAGTYTLTVTNPTNSCTNTDQVTVTLNTTVPASNAGVDQVLNCSSGTVVLNGSASAAGMTYSWTGPGIVSGGNTTSPTVNQAGTYTITVTNPTNGCSSTDDVIVTNNINIPSVDFTADTLNGCEQLTVSFTGIADPGLQYAWNFGDGGNAASLNAVHNYNTIGCFDVSLTVTNTANGCSNTHQMTDYICIVPNPTASFVVTPDDGCGPLTITMSNNSQNATIYDWSLTPGGTQQTVNLNPVTLTVNESTQIELTAWNSLGCQNSMTAFVTMLNCGCTDPLALNFDSSVDYNDGSCIYPPPSIHVPNVFTPNADGTNDFFEFSPVFIAEIQVTIVNRWGNLVFEGKGPDPKWDGKINSNEASDGTYFYKYTATSLIGEEFSGHGFVQLIRAN